MSKESQAMDFGSRYQHVSTADQRTHYVDSYIVTPMEGKSVQKQRSRPKRAKSYRRKN